VSALRPLAVFPFPLPEPQAQAVRAFKGAMSLDYQVTMVKALPGGPTRVLAFSEPDFLCDSYLIGSATDLAPGLSWVLGISDYHPQAKLVVDQLRDVFGPGLREVFDE
jgi:hypothetical protein